MSQILKLTNDKSLSAKVVLDVEILKDSQSETLNLWVGGLLPSDINIVELQDGNQEIVTFYPIGVKIGEVYSVSIKLDNSSLGTNYFGKPISYTATTEDTSEVVEGWLSLIQEKITADTTNSTAWSNLADFKKVITSEGVGLQLSGANDGTDVTVYDGIVQKKNDSSSGNIDPITISEIDEDSDINVSINDTIAEVLVENDFYTLDDINKQGSLRNRISPMVFNTFQDATDTQDQIVEIELVNVGVIEGDTFLIEINDTFPVKYVASTTDNRTKVISQIIDDITENKNNSLGDWQYVLEVRGLPLDNFDASELENDGVVDNKTKIQIRIKNPSNSTQQFVFDNNQTVIDELEYQANLSLVTKELPNYSNKEILEINQSLIEKGINTINDIAEMSRADFIKQMGPEIGDINALKLQAKAIVKAQLTESLATGLRTQGLYDNTILQDDLESVGAAAAAVQPEGAIDSLQSRFIEQSYCDPNETAVSPTAYLADLINYTLKTFKYRSANGNISPITIEELESTFYQNFVELPGAKDEITDRVSQSRVAIEVLRRYLNAEASDLNNDEQLNEEIDSWSDEVYYAFLRELGTNYNILVNTTSDDAKERLATKLGIKTRNLEKLLIDIPEEEIDLTDSQTQWDLFVAKFPSRMQPIAEAIKNDLSIGNGGSKTLRDAFFGYQYNSFPTGYSSLLEYFRNIDSSATDTIWYEIAKWIKEVAQDAYKQYETIIVKRWKQSLTNPSHPHYQWHKFIFSGFINTAFHAPIHVFINYKIDQDSDKSIEIIASGLERFSNLPIQEIIDELKVADWSEKNRFTINEIVGNFFHVAVGIIRKINNTLNVDKEEKLEELFGLKDSSNILRPDAEGTIIRDDRKIIKKYKLDGIEWGRNTSVNGEIFGEISGNTLTLKSTSLRPTVSGNGNNLHIQSFEGIRRGFNTDSEGKIYVTIVDGFMTLFRNSLERHQDRVATAKYDSISKSFKIVPSWDREVEGKIVVDTLQDQSFEINTDKEVATGEYDLAQRTFYVNQKNNSGLSGQFILTNLTDNNFTISAIPKIVAWRLENLRTDWLAIDKERTKPIIDPDVLNFADFEYPYPASSISSLDDVENPVDLYQYRKQLVDTKYAEVESILNENYNKVYSDTNGNVSVDLASPSGIIKSLETGKMYVSSFDDNTVKVFDYDATSDSYTLLSSLDAENAALSGPGGLAFAYKPRRRGRYVQVIPTNEAEKGISQVTKAVFPTNIVEGDIFFLDLNGNGTVYYIAKNGDGQAELAAGIKQAIDDLSGLQDQFIGDWRELVVSISGTELIFTALEKNRPFELTYRPLAVEEGLTILGSKPNMELEDQLINIFNTEVQFRDPESGAINYKFGGLVEASKVITQKNNVFVSEKNTKRVTRYTLPEKIQEYYQLNENKDFDSEDITLTVGKNNWIYVLDRKDYSADTTKNNSLKVFDQQWRLQFSLEQISGIPETDGVQYMHRPQAITVDDVGNIYISDTYKHRVLKLDPEGNFLVGFGDFDLATISPSAEDNKLAWPRSVKIDKDNNVFIVEQGGTFIVEQGGTEDSITYQSRIQKFDESGSWLATYDNEDFQIPALDLSSSQSSFVFEPNVNKIIDIEFGETNETDPENNKIYYIITDLHGDSNKDRILFLDENFKYIGHKTVNTHAVSNITRIASSDEYIFTRLKQVVKSSFNVIGGVVTELDTTSLNDPVYGGIYTFDFLDGIAIDSKGFVYVADNANGLGRIQKFRFPKAISITSVSDYNTTDDSYREVTPSAIAIDRQGMLYIGERLHGNIYKVDQDGVLQYDFINDQAHFQLDIVKEFRESGNTVFSESATAIQINEGGELVISNNHTGSTVSGVARIYIYSDKGKLQHFYLNAATSTSTETFNEITDIFLDTKGNILSTHFTTNQILSIDTTQGIGTTLQSFVEEHFVGGKKLSMHTFQQWKAKFLEGIDVEEELKSYQIGYAEFNEIMRLYDKSSSGIRLTDKQKESIINLLVAHWKKKQEKFWLQEEIDRDWILSQDNFVLLSSKAEQRLHYPSWRVKSTSRRKWRQSLKARIKLEESVIKGQEETVKEIEGDYLNKLRDILILKGPFTGNTLSEKAQDATDKLIIDYKNDYNQQTTRISMAIEALQGILWGARNGLIEDTYPNYVLDTDNFDEEWEWMGSYASWRSAQFVSMYPENLLQSSLKNTITPAFQKVLDTVKDENVTPEKACEITNGFYDDFKDAGSINVRLSFQTKIEFSEKCKFNKKKGLQDIVLLFGQVSNEKKYYWTYFDADNENTIIPWQPIEIDDFNKEKVYEFLSIKRYDNVDGEDYLYLFYRKEFNDKNEPLYYIKFNLKTLEWEDEVVEVKFVNVEFPVNTGNREIDRYTGKGKVIGQKRDRFKFDVVPENNEYLAISYWTSYYNEYHITIFKFDIEEDEFVKIPGHRENSRGARIWTRDKLTLLSYVDGKALYIREFSTNSQLLYFHKILGYYFNDGNGSDRPDNNIISRWNRGSDLEGWFLREGYYKTLYLEGAAWFISKNGNGSFGLKTQTNELSKSVIHIPGGLRNYGNNFFTYKNSSNQNKLVYHSIQRHHLVVQDVGLIPSRDGRHDILKMEGSVKHLSYRKLKNLSVGAVIDDDHIKEIEYQSWLYGHVYSLPTHKPIPQNMYAYVEETFFHVPMTIAKALQDNGFYEEALDWYRTVYDYGYTHLNKAHQRNKRSIYWNLELEGQPSLFYDKFIARLDSDNNANTDLDWLKDPFNPHAVAKSRPNTYTKYTVMQIVQCLEEYADSEYTKYDAESVPRARTLYQQAIELLDEEALKHLEDQSREEIEKVVKGWEPEDQGLKLVWSQLLQDALKLTNKQNVKDFAWLIHTILNVTTHHTYTWAEERKIKDLRSNLNAYLIKDVKIKNNASDISVARWRKNIIDGNLNSDSKISELIDQTATSVAKNQVDNFIVLLGIKKSVVESQNKVFPSNSIIGSLSQSNLGSLNAEEFSAQFEDESGIISLDKITGSLSDLKTSFVNQYSYNALNPTPNQVSMQRVLKNFISTLKGAASFSTSAKPEVSFSYCVPANPVVSYLRYKAQLSLFKIRKGRNISGVFQPIEPFAAPTDATSGLPSIGSRGSILSAGGGTLFFTPSIYRYDVLIARAKELVNVAQQVEGSYLSSLEKLDQERYSLLKAKQDLDVSKQGIKLQDLRLKRADNAIELAELQKDRAEISFDHYEDLIDKGLIGFEILGLSFQTLAVLQYNLAYGIFIASGTEASLNIIGGLAFGKTGNILDKVAKAVIAGAKAFEANSGYFNQLASYQRRNQEWQFQRELAAKDVEIAEQNIELAEDDKDIVEQEKIIAELQTQHAEEVIQFLKNKFTSAELYQWMSGVLKGVYGYFLRSATQMAKQAEKQLSFERQQLSAGLIKDDYWTPQTENNSIPANTGEAEDRRGITGSVRLLRDIYTLDTVAFEEDRNKLQLSKTISLAALDPVVFQQFKETGELTFDTSLQEFRRDFPAHYLRLIKKVKLQVIALVPPTDGIKATLRSKGTSVVEIGTQGGILPYRIRRSPESVSYTGTQNQEGAYELNPDANTKLFPFENTGVQQQWDLVMPKAANRFDFTTIADVLITMDYTALEDVQYQSQVVNSEDLLPTETGGQRPYSFNMNFGGIIYELQNPDRLQVQTDDDGNRYVEVSFNTSKSDFPYGLENISLENFKFHFVRGENFNVDSEVINVNILSLQKENSSGRVFKSKSAVEITDVRDDLTGNFDPDRMVLSTENGVGKVAWSKLITDTEVDAIWTMRISVNEGIGSLVDLIKKEKIVDILMFINYSATTAAWPESFKLSE